MAAFDLEAMLTKVQTIVTGIAGVQQVYVGVPESIGVRVAAYITLGPATPDPKTTGVQYRVEPQVMVTFAYRVAGAEAGAEVKLAQLVKAFTLALLADRTMGGVTSDLHIDTAGAGLPRYTAVAGSEFREWPMTIIGSQQFVT
jgi:hypothetical protein